MVDCKLVRLANTLEQFVNIYISLAAPSMKIKTTAQNLITPVPQGCSLKGYLLSPSVFTSSNIPNGDGHIFAFGPQLQSTLGDGQLMTGRKVVLLVPLAQMLRSVVPVVRT